VSSSQVLTLEVVGSVVYSCFYRGVVL
jgi:hypothetical protein